MKVMEGKVALFFIGQAMFKMAFLSQTSHFRGRLASGPLFTATVMRFDNPANYMDFETTKKLC